MPTSFFENFVQSSHHNNLFKTKNPLKVLLGTIKKLISVTEDWNIDPSPCQRSESSEMPCSRRWARLTVSANEEKLFAVLTRESFCCFQLTTNSKSCASSLAWNSMKS